jgi:hypothetical protein
VLSAEETAYSFVQQFLTAFNTNDTEAWLQLLQFPHVRITPTGRVFMETQSSARRGFQLGIQFRREQEWDHSVVDDVTVIQHTQDKIHFTNRFTRFKTDGSTYLTGHALWILVNVDGEWKRVCVSNIDVQRFDMSTEEFVQSLMRRDQLLEGEK